MAAVCVFCASSAGIDPRYLHLAAALGRALGQRGHSLVSGGGRVSMMGAVARAARAHGARTLGVIPAALRGLEVADEDADELVVTRDMRERKAVMEQRADAFLALPGGLGTLEELLEVWTSRSLGMHDKPVVVLDPDGVFDLLFELLDRMCGSGFVRESAYTALTRTRSAEDAFTALERGG
jgi:uncharacterized protein (TIGR00730 family)